MLCRKRLFFFANYVQPPPPIQSALYLLACTSVPFLLSFLLSFSSLSFLPIMNYTPDSLQPNNGLSQLDTEDICITNTGLQGPLHVMGFSVEFQWQNVNTQRNTTVGPYPEQDFNLSSPFSNDAGRWYYPYEVDSTIPSSSFPLTSIPGGPIPPSSSLPPPPSSSTLTTPGVVSDSDKAKIDEASRKLEAEKAKLAQEKREADEAKAKVEAAAKAEAEAKAKADAEKRAKDEADAAAKKAKEEADAAQRKADEKKKADDAEAARKAAEDAEAAKRKADEAQKAKDAADAAAKKAEQEKKEAEKKTDEAKKDHVDAVKDVVAANKDVAKAVDEKKSAVEDAGKKAKDAHADATGDCNKFTDEYNKLKKIIDECNNYENTFRETEKKCQEETTTKCKGDVACAVKLESCVAKSNMQADMEKKMKTREDAQKTLNEKKELMQTSCAVVEKKEVAVQKTEEAKKDVAKEAEQVKAVAATVTKDAKADVAAVSAKAGKVDYQEDAVASGKGGCGAPKKNYNELGLSCGDAFDSMWVKSKDAKTKRCFYENKDSGIFVVCHMNDKKKCPASFSADKCTVYERVPVCMQAASARAIKYW